MFRLDWEDAAFDGLADFCILHKDRWGDINGAVDVIEYRLQRNPLAHSREVAEGLRRIDLPPLALFFSVTGREITIVSVGWIG